MLSSSLSSDCAFCFFLLLLSFLVHAAVVVVVAVLRLSSKVARVLGIFTLFAKRIVAINIIFVGLNGENAYVPVVYIVFKAYTQEEE